MPEAPENPMPSGPISDSVWNLLSQAIPVDDCSKWLNDVKLQIGYSFKEESMSCADVASIRDMAILTIANEQEVDGVTNINWQDLTFEELRSYLQDAEDILS